MSSYRFSQAFEWVRWRIHAAGVDPRSVDIVALAHLAYEERPDIFDYDSFPVELVEWMFFERWVTVLEREISRSFKRIELVQIGDEETLESLGVLGDMFLDDDGYCPRGDLLVAPKEFFSERELERVLRAGGKIVLGYEVPFVPAIFTARNWSGLEERGVAYALDSETAALIMAHTLRLKCVEKMEV